ncbi:MAG: LamG-like jellyroll fold domain-containing protein [Planctomycetota bacterium]
MRRPSPWAPRPVLVLRLLAPALLAAWLHAPLLRAQEPEASPAATPPRVHTSSDGAHLLRLPKEDDAFGFVVFGDRTGGPVEGIEVLRQAVADTNLLDPDLVLTVGDLINGYNQPEQWRAQADEYKTAMQALRMPWFPVAGNHDIYWRGEGRPPGEHEGAYETTFGPLWYAVQHKQCWFVVLYSDEGDPATGKKDFNDPACQRFSDAQFEWLRGTLQQARAARHVFVFLHHPRWISDRYPGADWDRVHRLLAANGNVTAVFAGHIHRMRFDGERDGIQYYTVASVGAHLEMEAPAVGYLHEFHVVTVRPEGITVAALPVGTVIDPKEITGEISEDASILGRARLVEDPRGARFETDGSVDGLLQFDVVNPSRRPIELTLVPEGDETWTFAPDHTHVVVPPGGRGNVAMQVTRRATPGAPRPPGLVIRTDYLARGLRVSLPERRQDLFVAPPDLQDPPDATPGVLHLDGQGDSCVRVDDALLTLPDGPLTVEAWLRGDDLSGRRAVVAKTETSEFGLFASDGKLSFLVFVGGDYAIAGSDGPVLEPGRWHHVAGVFDGSTARVFLDGAPLAEVPTAGRRRTNAHPLLIGADPDRRGAPTSPFRGQLDEVRVSTVARYRAAFTPARRFAADDDTALLLHLDRDQGAWTADAGPRGAHGERRGGARSGPEIAR